MSNDGQVTLNISNSVAHITFDRPRARNAMTWRMYEDMAKACETIRSRDDIRVAILRGAGGKAFIAGTDIAQFADFSTVRTVSTTRNKSRSSSVASRHCQYPRLRWWKAGP